MFFIADNIVVFLFRTIMRMIFCSECQSWTKLEGTIEKVEAPEHTMYPYAEICYAYKVNDGRHSGKYKRGFWHDDSAQSFAGNFVPSERLVVRVHAANSEKSYVLEEDQRWWNE